MNKTILHIFVIVIIAIIFGGIGLLVGKDSCVPVDETQKQIMTDLKQKFDSKTKEDLIPFVLLGSSEEMYLSGKIDSLQHDTINVKVKNIFKSDDFFGYLDEPNFYIKTIKISEETEIIKQVMKDLEEFMDEIEEYNKDQTGLPPLPFKEIPISLKELQKDTKVSVETDTIINLKENEVIDARKIIITTDNNNDSNN